MDYDKLIERLRTDSLCAEKVESLKLGGANITASRQRDGRTERRSP